MTPAFVASFVATFAVFLGTPLAAKVDIVDNVLILHDDNFDLAIKKYPMVMVAFTSEYKCSKCTELKEFYHHSAKALLEHNPPIRLAMVDTADHSTLGLLERFDIHPHKGSTKLPYVWVYKNGVHHSDFHCKVKETVQLVAHMEAVGGHPLLWHPRHMFNVGRCEYLGAFRKLKLRPKLIIKVLFIGCVSLFAIGVVAVGIWAQREEHKKKKE